jgi:aminoacyl tRNA synthase complex-interacting multifunctional protein 1
MLNIAKNDVMVRIVRHWIGSRIQVPFQLVEEATSMDVEGKSLSGSFAVSTHLLNLAKLESLLGRSEEERKDVFHWGLEAQKTFREGFVHDRTKTIGELNELLATKTFIATNEFTLADVAMYATLYNVPFMVNDKSEYPNVIRYFDCLQHIVKENAPEAGLNITEIDLEVPFVPRAPVEREKKETPAKQEVSNDKKSNEKQPSSKPQESKKESKSKPAESQKAIDPSKLDIRVGKILSVERHPDAESLYVEKVDLGEPEPRTVVSGLVKYMTVEQLDQQMVLLLCNLKPAKMRGIESQAMVLCATSSDGNTVEFLQPPAGARVGDRASFDGFSGEPEAQLKSKQKIWETIQPLLVTNNACQATFTNEGKESLLKTSLGPCFVKSVKGAPIK